LRGIFLLTTLKRLGDNLKKIFTQQSFTATSGIYIIDSDHTFEIEMREELKEIQKKFRKDQKKLNLEKSALYEKYRQRAEEEGWVKKL
jgi:hypothetical protein